MGHYQGHSHSVPVLILSYGNNRGRLKYDCLVVSIGATGDRDRRAIGDQGLMRAYAVAGRLRATPSAIPPRHKSVFFWTP